MISVKANITSIAQDYKTRKVVVTFEYVGNPADIERLQDNAVRLDVKQYRERRSNNANSYFWELCNKLAYVLKKSSVDVYRAYIKDVPNNYYIGLLRDEDVEQAKAMWESRGTGWIAEAEESSVKGCKNMTYYYGSSCYDTVQMSVLLDLVKRDCEEQGISTLTPNEIEELKRRWGDEI